MAISRTLGDLFGHSVGVSSDPEVSYKELDGTEKFILIGSDGVWDVMNTSEAAGFVFTKSQNSKENIAQHIVDECRARWEVVNSNNFKNENEKSYNLIRNDINSVNRSNPEIRHKNTVIDDITAVICFFNIE